MFEDQIITGIAVFLGSILGGICVAEYTLHRGKNMISNGIAGAIKQLPITEIMKLLTKPTPKKEPENHD